jgi:hypothetical protein
MALMGESEVLQDDRRADIGALVVFDLREGVVPDRFAGIREHGWEQGL